MTQQPQLKKTADEREEKKKKIDEEVNELRVQLEKQDSFLNIALVSFISLVIAVAAAIMHFKVLESIQ